MLKELFSLRSCSFVSIKCLFDEVNSIFWNFRPNWIRKLEIWSTDTTIDFLFALASKGWATCQEDISNDTCTPDINCLGVLLFLNDFRRHVQRAATLKWLIRCVVCSKAEIWEFYVENLGIITLKKNVLRFKISVHNTLLVDIVESQEYLIDQIACLDFIKSFHFYYPIKKLTTTYEFWHNIVVLIVFKELINAHYLRMRRSMKHLKLILH